MVLCGFEIEFGMVWGGLGSFNGLLLLPDKELGSS